VDALDRKMKEWVAAQYESRKIKSRARAFCPSTEDFYRFVTNDLEGDALQRMVDYLRQNPEDQDFVVQAREVLKNQGEAEGEKVPERWIDRARHPRVPFQKTSAAQKKRLGIYLVCSVVFFLASFLVRRYFVQCLVLSLLSGILWVVERRAFKTQVLIYKSLAENSDSESSDKSQRQTSSPR
jgi:hypothetical protein